MAVNAKPQALPKGIQMPLGLAPRPLRDVPLTENARVVMTKRYVRKDEKGQPAETIQDTFWRVASNVAMAEDEPEKWAQVYYDLLTDLRFLPNSPTFTGAGTPLGNLSACFVLPIEDEMGAYEGGIFQTLRDAALIQKTGGGNGFSFSRLRAKGALVKTSNGQASGPVGFLKAYDQAFGIVNQGGARRGANMGVLRVDHPDIREFITCKTDETAVTNFNISVAITDKFMEAVEKDDMFDLIEPSTGEVAERVRARELFDMIVQYAHHNGEPGALFIDAANRSNPIPHVGAYEATNPCVTGDTRVYTNRGLVKAVDLFDDETEIEVVTDGRFGLDANTTPSTRVFMTGTKPVFRLQTREGYYLRATANHRIMTPSGWTELRFLKPGDRIHILNRKGGFGQQGSLELGRVLGWIIGDGTIKANAAVLSFFGEEKRELAPMFAQYVDTMVANRTSETAFRKHYPVGVTEIAERDEARIVSERLRQIAEEHGLVEKKHRVPESVYQGTEAMQRGFLQALFTADGSFQDGGQKGGSIRLASSHAELLEQTQQILMNFGIASRIYRERRPAGYRKMPDSNRELKEYWCEAQHELVISKRNMVTFADEIGFLMGYKQSALRDYVSRGKRGPYGESFLATVESIEHDGVEDVYDLTEPLTSSFIANSLVIHNCGEQFLLPYESCNLGSINLALHVTDNGRVDWELLQRTIEEGTRFLDDVVSVNHYVDAVPQLREAALRSRRIGLGFMGLADMMIKVGLRYGSEEGQEFAAQVTEFMRYHCMKTSIDIAKARGSFPAIKGSIFDPDDFRWETPQPLVPYERDFGRPALDWKTVVKGIKKHGIRNAAVSTQAPTGTISTVSGCEGYGIEPIFALAYTRYVVDGDKRMELHYGSPLLEDSLRKAGLDDLTIQKVIDQVSIDGNCQNIDAIPEALRNVLVVSSDITPDEHVRMQASIQMFVDNSISKTNNLPATATVEDVKHAYRTAWELGCKGLTVYVTGSRDVVVLETKATKEAKENRQQAAEPQPEPQPQTEIVPAPSYQETKKPRPMMLEGKTFRMPTPVGTAYITINENGHGAGQPFEVFINTSKAGSEIAAISEAIGRLISLILRQTSPVSQRDRVREIVDQLGGIGGGRQTGFGPNRVASLPDGVSKTLEAYLQATSETVSVARPAVELHSGQPNGSANSLPTPAEQHAVVIGDICPDCGSATLIRKEGCISCHECGYSEC